MVGCFSIGDPRTGDRCFGIRAQQNDPTSVRVVFDICVPRPLRKHLPGHEIRTAQEMGWDTLQNGDLIRAAERLFDVLVTSDQNLRYQQNLTQRRLAIVVLPTNFLPAVLRLAPKLSVTLARILAGDFIEIEMD